MGVMPNLFSSDSRDCTDIPKKGFVPVEGSSTPDPTNFKVMKEITVNGYPIFFVNYPGVKNYEGNKILMYPKFFNTGLLKLRMDPHFFTKGDSPIARFEPTRYGWELAIKLAESL